MCRKDGSNIEVLTGIHSLRCNHVEQTRLEYAQDFEEHAENAKMFQVAKQESPCQLN